MATSMAAGGSIQSLAALVFFSSNMLPGVISSRGRFPQSRPCPRFETLSSVLHQLRTHFPTLPCDRVSAPRWKGRYDMGSSPLIMPSVWSPRDRPSTPEAFILFPEMCRTCRIMPPSL